MKDFNMIPFIMNLQMFVYIIKLYIHKNVAFLCCYFDLVVC